MHNFDEIRQVYYRDATAVFEAFKIGATQMRAETNPARWVDGYDFPAVRDGRVRKLTFTNGNPAGMTGLVFNTRRTKFADIRVRRAFTLAFDGPAINRALFHDRFVRSDSFFARSSLASTGRPADALERRLLAPFQHLIHPDVMEGRWRAGRRRARARIAR